MNYYYEAASHADGSVSKEIPVALFRTNGSSIAEYWDKGAQEWRFDEWFLWNLWGIGGNSVPYVEISKERVDEIIKDWSSARARSLKV